MEGKAKVDLNNFKNARMYKRFIKEKSPSICVTGEFDITKLYRLKKKHSLNAMLCYCIQEAGQSIDEFHYSIKEDGLYYYKNVKTNAVIIGEDGQHYYVDYKYNASFCDFEKEYRRANEYCSKNCVHLREDTGALLATSTVTIFPFQSFDIGFSETFWDNFLIWGRFKKKGFKVKLNITLRFHHAIIDGVHAGMLFKELQKQINNFKAY